MTALPPMTDPSYFEAVAKLHQRVKPLLDGTMIPRMPYWWCPAEELTLPSVSRFLLSHLLVWGGFALLAAWLFTPWAAIVYACVFVAEIAQLLIRKRLPSGSILEAVHGCCVGIIYAAIAAFAMLLVSAFVINVGVQAVWWRGIGLAIVTGTTYIGLNAGQGLRQHIRRGRSSYAGAALQIFHASMLLWVLVGLILGFREQLGGVLIWGIFAVIGLAIGAMQQGFGEYRYRMPPRELTKVFLAEFTKSALLIGIANLVLFSLSRLPTPSELLILWLAPSLIMFDTKTASVAELQYAQWRDKAYSLGFPIRELQSLSKQLSQNTALLAESLKRYPTYFLRAFTWQPMMLTSVPASTRNAS